VGLAAKILVRLKTTMLMDTSLETSSKIPAYGCTTSIIQNSMSLLKIALLPDKGILRKEIGEECLLKVPYW